MITKIDQHPSNKDLFDSSHYQHQLMEKGNVGVLSHLTSWLTCS